MDTVSREDWKQHAACRPYPTALFFPAQFDGDTTDGDAEIAKQICASCPVHEECAAEQLREPYGVRARTAPEDRGFRNLSEGKRVVYRGAKAALIHLMSSSPDELFWADKVVEHFNKKWPPVTFAKALGHLHTEGRVTRYPPTPESGRQKRYQWNQEQK